MPIYLTAAKKRAGKLSLSKLHAKLGPIIHTRLSKTMSMESFAANLDHSPELNRSPLGEIIFPERNQDELALQDLWQGIKKWNIWLMMAYQDIKVRYRRSVLGPFWITLSMAITAYTMGYLYGHLFHMDMQNYFPFLVGSMLAWTFISSTITDLVETFTMSETMIKQIKLPYTVYVNKVIARNFIIFLHNIPIIIPIIAIFHETAKINLYTFLLLPSLVIMYINATTYGLMLAMIGARFRDISQIIKSLIQVIFFITPVMWKPEILPLDKQFIAYINPFFAFIELIRCPLIGTLPSRTSCLMISLVTILGLGLSFKMFSRYRARIIYWL